MLQMLMAVLKMYQSKIAQRNGGTNPICLWPHSQLGRAWECDALWSMAPRAELN